MTAHASTRPATSSTTAVPPALPHPGLRPTALERRKTLPEPPDHPQTLSHPPSSPQIPQKRVVSTSTEWYTPPEPPTTLSSPANTPRPPPTPCTLPIRPSLPQLDCKRAVSPASTPSPTGDASSTTVLRPLPPAASSPSPVPLCSTALARFDWAEDAASIPITPSTRPRDLSDLKTGCVQPFGTLRRRTRRRRAPPRVFPPSRQNFYANSSFYVYPPHAQPFITRRHPSGIGPGKPIVITPFGVPTPAPVPPAPILDWDQDPRLVNLSQALCALGWTPPC